MIRLALAFVLALAVGAARADALPAPVAQALARAGVPQSAVGLYVQQVDAPRPTAIFNPSQPMNPASVMKLVTTFAALDLLGPGLYLEDRGVPARPARATSLDGDLLLKGYGDPKLTVENFWLFLRAMRARGLREVRGDLVLDRSFFDAGDHDPANSTASAAAVQRRRRRAARQLQGGALLLPAERGGADRGVVPEPKLAQLEVAASVALRDGPCGDWRSALRYDLQQSGATARASFSGSMPASCGERVWNLAPLPHDQYVFGLFKSLWQELGGALTGGVREGRAPAGARPFAQFESPAAAEVLRDMNKFSNNVMARQVFLTLSAETLQLPGRYDRSARAVKSWLEARKLDVPDLVIENGSGLSRADRISAEGMGRLLLAAYHSAVMPEFIATMPLVAYDGTMRKRMRLEGVAGHAHVKTGSLNDVRSVAGYVLDRNGRRHAVAFFVNHAAAHASQPAQDALLKWVHDVAR